MDRRTCLADRPDKQDSFLLKALTPISVIDLIRCHRGLGEGRLFGDVILPGLSLLGWCQLVLAKARPLASHTATVLIADNATRDN